MSILDSAAKTTAEVGDFVRNPFQKSVNNVIRAPDFPNGFEIEEQGPTREKIRLPGHLMPQVPFTFGGEQRTVKEFYPGNSEPVVHIMGPSENDITITGRLWDKPFSAPPPSAVGPPLPLLGKRGIANAIALQLEEFRIRGNLLKIKLGDFQRFGILIATQFDMKDLADIRYSLTFTIIGFSPPLRSQFAGETIEPPLATNQELNQLLNNFNLQQVPTSMPQSLGDVINGAISDVAGVIATVTGTIDDIITAVEEIEGSIDRAIGVVKNAETFMIQTKRRVGAIGYTTGTLLGLGITDRYINISFISAQITFYTSFQSLLEEMRRRFSSIALTVPIARHLVIEGDTLQSLAQRFYDDDTQWKEIFDHNKLTSTDLVPATVLEIPRI